MLSLLLLSIPCSLRHKELAKQIALKRDMSLRTAYRRIREHLEMEDIYCNKMTAGDVSTKPFKFFFLG
jgi:hypothetical protein